MGGRGDYSPGRIKLLLWHYHSLVRVTRAIAQPSDSQRLPKEHAEGGFEDGASIKADLDEAMKQLEPVVARVVWDYYVAGYAAVEINRWFVDRARHRGVRQMALVLGWRPRKKLQLVAGIVTPVDELLEDGPVKERMRMVVARALRYCPASGPPGYSCPVVRCRGYFHHDTGDHVGARYAPA
jgi:hypothetical protein